LSQSFSRLQRRRDMQATNSKTSTVNIFDVDVKDQPSEESGTIIDGPVSKCINDFGYCTFNDRNIVVAHRKLGESNALLREHTNIRHCIDLKTTRDDSF
jgi:hypothetical protein